MAAEPQAIAALEFSCGREVDELRSKVIIGGKSILVDPLARSRGGDTILMKSGIEDRRHTGVKTSIASGTCSRPRPGGARLTNC